MTDGLKDAHREAIVAAIAANDRVERAVLFGSRATGANTVTSDVDIALFGERLTLTDQARLAAALDELPMAQRVDLLLYTAIDSPALREQIERHGVEWYRRPPGTANTPIVEGAGNGTRPRDSTPQSPPNCGSPGVTARRTETRTGGRPATTGTIAGDFALSVGMPDKPAPEGWRWTKITDVARLETGHTPSRKYPEYWGGEVPWIGIKDATSNHGRTIYDTIQHTNELGIANSSARILPANTVCLSRTASVGYVVVMGCPMATSQDFVNWVCSPELDHRFLKYVLLSEHSAFLRFASGTTHQTIYFPEVKAFHVGLPSPAEQRAIAHILGTLDDKIEVNRRMNATLEAMARAIFKDWFVDFGPTRAKMAMQGKDPQNQNTTRKPYLAPDIWDLFPDRLDDEGKPEGWEGKPLTEFFSIIGGGTPKTSNADYWTGLIPWFSVTDTPAAGSVFVTTTEKTITDAGLHGSSARLVPKGTTIISARGTVGNLAVAGCEMAFNQSCYGLKGAAPVGNYATYLIAQNMVNQLRAMAHGSVFSTITRQTFESLSLPMPSPGILEYFEYAVSPLFEKIFTNVEESHTLAQIRDLLLPRLMSGEIRLKDAERTVEEVT